MRDFQMPGRSPVFAENAICATSHPLATQAALRILQDGGNAVDAAIAGAVLLGLCEPHGTSIGGDLFVLVKPPASDDIIALNGSGRAPGGLDAERLRATGASEIDGLSADAVTLPGAIDGFCRLSEDWGRAGLAASLAPAIHYAECGLPISPRVAHDWARNASRLQGVARDWYLLDGQPPRVGQIWRHKGQAEVLRRVAAKGRAGFYEGEVAADMVAALAAAGGSHTLDDFAATRSEYVTPLSGDYRGFELIEHPPNTQGATAILMAHILSHFDIGALDPFGAERAHLEAEAAKFAYDARDRFIGDADRATRIDHMLSAKTGADLAGKIDPGRANPLLDRQSGAMHLDTVYLSVVDRDRMAVSLIYSMYFAFGSGLASDRFGILFQNRGAGFTLEPGHPNEAGPGKRPLHTIIPALARQGGQVVMPFGVMGGAYQPTGHIRLLSNIVDFGMDVQQALDGPRSFAYQGKLELERGYAPGVSDQLAALGHACQVAETPLGGGQAIWIDAESGVLTGGSDPRKDGLAIGY